MKGLGKEGKEFKEGLWERFIYKWFKNYSL